MTPRNRKDRAATTHPELKLGSHLLPGLAAVALFVVMAITFVQARFPAPEGFPEDANITASIGYAMFNIAIDGIEGTLVAGEAFLVPFEIIDLVLVAALTGAILLARREQEGESVTALLTDGGRRTGRALADGGRRTGRALADGGRGLLGRDTPDTDGEKTGRRVRDVDTGTGGDR